MSYCKLNTPCTCSPFSLEMCAEIVGPSFIYNLSVHPNIFFDAKRVLREMGASVENHVLAPYINLHQDPSLGPTEWILSANGRSAGSPGC
jgi:hypothetical protein